MKQSLTVQRFMEIAEGVQRGLWASTSLWAFLSFCVFKTAWLTGVLVNSHLFLWKTWCCTVRKWVYHWLRRFVCLIHFLGRTRTALAVRLSNFGSLNIKLRNNSTQLFKIMNTFVWKLISISTLSCVFWKEGPFPKCSLNCNHSHKVLRALTAGANIGDVSAQHPNACDLALQYHSPEQYQHFLHPKSP